MTISTTHPEIPDASVPPITEDDIAGYLVNTPEFFERHAEVLTGVQLTSPHGARAVSLQERQAEMLREKIKGLEQRLMAMVRNSHENTAIADRLHRWSLVLAGTADPSELPARTVEAALEQFSLPQAAVRVWEVAPGHRLASFARDPGEELRAFAASLGEPYCGPNRGFDAVRLLDRPDEAASLALMPLRTPEGDCFGLLVLASPEPARFDAAMGTDFLQRMAAIASAALGRLRD
ncbi:DUF484 family protein [Xylophilus rhododendri]|uniref:DUF484 family protein n=1 Tax=Xylophilus rhododendri TaxID=2697032 RepID=A0A857J9R6_9BURK|nr:DUF484 family protein [Xylophilus rhododendri]QHI99732.1 DUF484 family protein [Xylophilus rhododendri]